MRAPEEQIFEFGDFTLAPKERLLLRTGEAVSLTPKAFDMLVVLVRHAGHLVCQGGSATRGMARHIRRGSRT